MAHILEHRQADIKTAEHRYDYYNGKMVSLSLKYNCERLVKHAWASTAFQTMTPLPSYR